MISAGELASMQHDVLPAMPDTASVYRAAATSSAGGWSQWPANWPAGATPHHTTKCRLIGLTAPIEQTAAAEIASVSRWRLVVPFGSDIRLSDRVLVSGHTFEVVGEITSDSWNITDTIYLSEILRT